MRHPLSGIDMDHIMEERVILDIMKNVMARGLGSKWTMDTHPVPTTLHSKWYGNDDMNMQFNPELKINQFDLVIFDHERKTLARYELRNRDGSKATTKFLQWKDPKPPQLYHLVEERAVDVSAAEREKTRFPLVSDPYTTDSLKKLKDSVRALADTTATPQTYYLSDDGVLRVKAYPWQQVVKAESSLTRPLMSVAVTHKVGGNSYEEYNYTLEKGLMVYAGDEIEVDLFDNKVRVYRKRYSGATDNTKRVLVGEATMATERPWVKYNVSQYTVSVSVSRLENTVKIKLGTAVSGIDRLKINGQLFATFMPIQLLAGDELEFNLADQSLNVYRIVVEYPSKQAARKLVAQRMLKPPLLKFIGGIDGASVPVAIFDESHRIPDGPSMLPCPGPDRGKHHFVIYDEVHQWANKEPYYQLGDSKSVSKPKYNIESAPFYGARISSKNPVTGRKRGVYVGLRDHKGELRASLENLTIEQAKEFVDGVRKAAQKSRGKWQELIFVGTYAEQQAWNSKRQAKIDSATCALKGCDWALEELDKLQRADDIAVNADYPPEPMAAAGRPVGVVVTFIKKFGVLGGKGYQYAAIKPYGVDTWSVTGRTSLYKVTWKELMDFVVQKESGDFRAEAIRSMCRMPVTIAQKLVDCSNYTYGKDEDD